MAERFERFKREFEDTGFMNNLIWLTPEMKKTSEFHEPDKAEEYIVKEYREEDITPTEFNIISELDSLCKEIPKRPAFTYKKRREEFRRLIRDKVIADLTERNRQIEMKKKEVFDKEELERKQKKDKEYLQKFEKEVAEYKLRLELDKEFLLNELKKAIDNIPYFPVDVGYGIRIEDEGVYLTLHLPSLADFIERNSLKPSYDRYGNPKVKSEKEIEEEYLHCVTALAFIFSVSLFNQSPAIKELIVNGYVVFDDSATGNERTEFLYSLLMPRKILENLNFEKMNSISGFSNFNGYYDFRKNKEIYFINSFMQYGEGSEGKETQEKKTSSSENDKEYIGSGPGKEKHYKVGKDIPFDDYFIFKYKNEYSGYFSLSSDANGNNIVVNENFQYNSIVSLQEKGYLELLNAYLVPLREVEKINLEEAEMVRVGVDIEPGEYKLLQKEEDESTYFCIYTDIQGRNNNGIVANGGFDDSTYIEVEEENILQIQNCTLIKED